MSDSRRIKYKTRFEKISNNSSGDALIIHGMFSGAGNMYPLRRALIKRNCYRKIHLIEMPLTHKLIPQIISKKHAEELAIKLESRIRKENFKGPIDIIGHSNGGYVALGLTNLIDHINYVYTISTPPGLIKEYGLKRSNFKKIIHFIGKKDLFYKELSLNSTVTDSELVLQFQDEGHCSIHSGADHNGLADIISYLNGGKYNHIFLDQESILHIWPFCEHEVPKYKRRSISNHTLTVCNGVHDKYINVLEKNYDNSKDIIHNIINYYYLRKSIKEQINHLKLEHTRILPFKRELKKEYDMLNQEIGFKEKRLHYFEKELNKRTRFFIEKNKRKAKTFLEPLELALLISKSNPITNEKLLLLNNLLRTTNSNLNEFTTFNKSLIEKKISLKSIS